VAEAWKTAQFYLISFLLFFLSLLLYAFLSFFRRCNNTRFSVEFGIWKAALRRHFNNAGTAGFLRKILSLVLGELREMHAEQGGI
jgi:hypothetical protein